MKIFTKRSLAWLTSLLMIVSLFSSLIVLPVEAATVDYVKNGDYIYNWGTRETVATFLSPNAEKWYQKNNTSYEELAALDGSSTVNLVPTSPLYKELQSLMKSNHKKETSYNGTRDLFQYTDCENSGKTSKKISSFYSGAPIGPAWDGGSTWNREHTWPNSKGDASGNGENDIFMLRPTSKSENSSRGNTAYGESGGYYHPNSESGGKYDLRGDVARIMLFVYCRWGNTSKMWGTAGVMESKDVLLKWVTEDPVDTWELGRNDSAESITGTRNVFVDYPELIFIMFGAEIPDDYQSPSGEGASNAYNINATSNNTAYGTVSVKGSNINATPKDGYVATGYTILSGSATVVQNGNVFTVTASSDVNIRIDFAPRSLVTLTFVHGSVLNTITAYSGDKVTLPAFDGDLPDIGGVHFVGWTETTVSKTTDLPTYYEEGSQYTLTKNTTLYALISSTTENDGTQSNVFEPYTGPLTEGDYLVMGSDAVMIGALTDKTRLQYEEVTLVNGNILSPSANAVWHIAPNGDSWTLLNLGNGNYAAGTGYKSSNQATLIATITDFAKWNVTNTSKGYDFINVGNEAAGVNPLLRHNGSVGFACYAKNTSVGTSITLYKRSSYTTYYYTHEVSEQPDYATGDVNGDGKVNNRDLAALQKHLNEWEVVVVEIMLDVNGDSKVNNRDLAALQKILNA